MPENQTRRHHGLQRPEKSPCRAARWSSTTIRRPRESTAALLKLQGFTITTAADGAEALTVFARDWYPLVITSRSIPTLDGIEIASRLRVIALAPVYVIMLTGNADARDHELGYCAGVDQYLLMQNYPGDLVGKAEAGMVCVASPSFIKTGRLDEPATVDLEKRCTHRASPRRPLVRRDRAVGTHPRHAADPQRRPGHRQ